MCTTYFGWQFCDYTWQKSARLYLARKLILEWRYIGEGLMYLKSTTQMFFQQLIRLATKKYCITNPFWVEPPAAGQTWRRHQMEAFPALLAICAGNSPAPGEFPAQRPVTRSFDVFFDLHPNIRLSKQWWGWWFETPSSPLWCHCNENVRTSCRHHGTKHSELCYNWNSGYCKEFQIDIHFTFWKW